MESSCRLAHTSVSVCLSVCLSVCVRKVYCSKTADLIQMPFGVMNGVGRGMGVLDRGGDRRRGRGILGMNMGRSIVTNRDFVAVVQERRALPKRLWGGFVFSAGRSRTKTRAHRKHSKRILSTCWTDVYKQTDRQTDKLVAIPRGRMQQQER